MIAFVILPGGVAPIASAVYFFWLRPLLSNPAVSVADRVRIEVGPPGPAPEGARRRLQSRFTTYGLVITACGAAIVFVGLAQGGAAGMFVAILGAIAISLGLFLALTSALRIGPGGKMFANRKMG